MKTPDPANDPLRRATAPPAEPGPRSSDEREAPKFRPRYVALPMRRSRIQGQRNLIWGVAVLLLSGALLAWAICLVGPESAYHVVCSAVAGLVLFVAARARLLRQRNGAFLASAFVCFVAVLMILAQEGWRALAHQRSAGPVVIAAALPSPAPTPVAKPTVKARQIDKPVLFANVFQSDSDEPVETVKVKRDFQVEIDGQSYIIRAGDVYPLAGMGKGEVRVPAGDQSISLPADAVQVQARKLVAKEPATSAAAAPTPAPPAVETAAMVTDKSQREAIRRFPGLGVKGSRENQLFIEAVQELKFTGGMDFFRDPTWPLRLAEMVADREGWKRGGENAIAGASAETAPDDPKPELPKADDVKPEEKPEQTGKPEKADEPAASEKMERPDKAETAERPEKPESPIVPDDTKPNAVPNVAPSRELADPSLPMERSGKRSE